MKLQDAVRQAKSQEQAILLLFKRVKKPMSPSQVLKRLRGLNFIKYNNTPVTSIRARMTTLVEKGELEKTTDLVKGTMGRDVHLWCLPSWVIGEQAEMSFEI